MPKNRTPKRLKTIAEYHQLMGLSKPENPLISLIDFADIKRIPGAQNLMLSVDYYSIALKRNFNARMKYGQQDFDFDNGIMSFMAPGQVFKIEYEGEKELDHSGYLLLVHPDFLWNTALAKTIGQYEYFGYAVNEALHLSEKEEATVTAIMKNIEQEYQSSIDQFGHTVVSAQLELLLAYAERFYHRQFLTRKAGNHRLLGRLEQILTSYFSSDVPDKQGLPSVQYIASTLNVSPNYLSGLLKALTGQSTQQHIHDKLIEKAKEKLSTTDLSVSEIAYELGFEHSQSFSKLFKSKTQLSPGGFRHSLN